LSSWEYGCTLAYLASTLFDDLSWAEAQSPTQLIALGVGQGCHRETLGEVGRRLQAMVNSAFRKYLMYIFWNQTHQSVNIMIWISYRLFFVLTKQNYGLLRIVKDCENEWILLKLLKL
jgi:hypothetical protein